MPFPISYTGSVQIKRYPSVEAYVSKLAGTLEAMGALNIVVSEDSISFRDSRINYVLPEAEPFWGVTSADILVTPRDGVLNVSYEVEFALTGAIFAIALIVALVMIFSFAATTSQKALFTIAIVAAGALLYAIQVIPSILLLRKALRKHYR